MKATIYASMIIFLINSFSALALTMEDIKASYFSKNPSEVFGLSLNASDKEFKRAYLRQFSKVHPDKLTPQERANKELFSAAEEAAKNIGNVYNQFVQDRKDGFLTGRGNYEEEVESRYQWSDTKAHLDQEMDRIFTRPSPVQRATDLAFKAQQTYGQEALIYLLKEFTKRGITVIDIVGQIYIRTFAFWGIGASSFLYKNPNNAYVINELIEQLVSLNTREAFDLLVRFNAASANFVFLSNPLGYIHKSTKTGIESMIKARPAFASHYDGQRIISRCAFAMGT